MNPYYTANTIFVVLSMMIMLTAVSFNTTLDQQRKNITRVLFLVISTAALCEWLGNALDGAPAESIGLHKLVKYVELCSAPYLGLLCGKSLSSRVLWEKSISCLLAFHVVQELQTFRRYQQSGSVMVLLVTVFLANGIAVTLHDNNVEIIWLVVAISAIMLYKFYGDILQQVDGLTELGNRWSFEDHLKRYRGTGVILFFDVDHFKMINDTYGHAVGDKCLCTVAQGLREVYGASGRCFRMGGDEFCVVLRRDLDRVEQLNAEFDAWHKEHIGSDQPVMSISIGWEAFDTGTESVKEAFRRADEAMYHAKNACKEAHMKETDAASQI